MKIGILADSHDNLPALAAAAARFKAAGVEQILHAGDFIAPFSLPPLVEAGAPVTAVFGNNDGERLYLATRFKDLGWTLQPKFAFLELAGRRIAMHHEPEPVEALAASGLYDLVVYGHSHTLEIRQAEEVLVVNPGECGGWLTGEQTVVIVDLPSMKTTVERLNG